MKTIFKAAGLLFAALAVSMPCLGAEDYPTKPIRLVIPWPPGGITDVISRSLGAVMSESLGEQIVPDNRPGAAGTLGVSIVASAAPDGYTLMMHDVPSHAISASLYTKLTYNPAKDIEPIFLAARSPLVLVINPKLPVNSIQQLIDYAKARPSQVSFASSGPGSITHLTAERFKNDTGLNLLHVPYKGGSPATAAVVSGESNMYFACIAAALPHIKAGRLKFLGITSAKRSSLFPDVPAVSEVIHGFEAGCNTGLFATGGTPQKIVQRLYEVAKKAEDSPRMKQVLATNSAEPGHFTPAQFKDYVKTEMRDWAKVVRAANLKVD